MDATEKIKQLLKQRGWSAYRLAKESDLSDSTIANIIKRNAVPSVTTLESICKGFGITMSQFFADGELIEVNDKTRDLLDCWSASAVNELLYFFSCSFILLCKFCDSEIFVTDMYICSLHKKDE